MPECWCRNNRFWMKKSLLDAILSLEGQDYTINEMAAMCGLERHTVASRLKERETGDFIGVASKLKREKSPEELLYDAAKSLTRNVERLGAEVVVKAIGMMRPHIREDALARIIPQDNR